jgi:alpha-beta hydrolase superfamily lysophospholipase
MTTIGVNSYLWRAAIDTLSFAPLISADSSGGVIVTDWYSRPGNPGERVKLTVSILDRDLRADALRVAASRQVNQGGAMGQRAGHRRHRPEARGHHPDARPRPAPRQRRG